MPASIGILCGLLALCGPAACTSSDRSPVPEAGIRSVSFEGVPEAALRGPLLVIGEGELDPNGTLSSVTYPRFGPSSTLLVPNARREIRVYTERGDLASVMGRVGDGPGEFRNLWNIQSLKSEVMAYDANQQRVTWFDYGGEVRRDAQIETVLAIPEGLHTIRGESLIGVQRPRPDGRRMGVITRHVTLLHFDTLGALTAQGPELDGGLIQVGSDGGGIVWDGTPFAASVHLGASASVGYVVEGDLAVIRALAPDGSQRWITRIDEARTPVTEAMAAAWCEERRCEGPGRPLVPQFPDSLPAVARIATSSTSDELWLARYSAPPFDTLELEWWVMSGDGHPVRSVRVPSSLRITDIEGSRVLGVYTDEMDRQTVRVYELVLPTDSK